MFTASNSGNGGSNSYSPPDFGKVGTGSDSWRGEFEESMSLAREEAKRYTLKKIELGEDLQWAIDAFGDGKSDEPKEKKVYQRLLTIAKSMVYNNVSFIDITDGATHYHADYVKPAWAKVKTRTTRIGNHIFYRWETGQRGGPVD